AINSCAADDIVNNTGSSVSGDVAVFSGVSGKIVSDTGVVAADIVTNGSTTTTGNIAVFSDGTGRVIQDGGHAPIDYLLLAGGTMVGSIDMGGQTITNITSETFTDEIIIPTASGGS